MSVKSVLPPPSFLLSEEELRYLCRCALVSHVCLASVSIVSAAMVLDTVVLDCLRCCCVLLVRSISLQFLCFACKVFFSVAACHV